MVGSLGRVDRTLKMDARIGGIRRRGARIQRRARQPLALGKLGGGAPRARIRPSDGAKQLLLELVAGGLVNLLISLPQRRQRGRELVRRGAELLEQLPAGVLAAVAHTT